MGKDNVKFHAVFFPEQQLAVDDGWKTVDMLKSMNFLNFEGGKFSKSEQRGIFLDAAIDVAPSDAWRYALMASAPETDDTDFTIERFADIVNKDLNGMLGNFVSRATKLTEKNFGLTIPAAGAWDAQLAAAVDEKIDELTKALAACEFRAAIVALRGLYAIGNEYMTIKAPWTLVKNGDVDAAGAVLNNCFQLIDLYSRVSAPFIPDAAEKIRDVFATAHDLTWPGAFEHRIADGEGFTVPENLFERIDNARVAELTQRFAPKKDDTPRPVVAKIVAAAAHPTRDGLQILTVDDGVNNALQIVCAAPNARAGLVSVLAPVGCKLPGQKKPISQRTVAGTESFGMMCSDAELGRGETAEKIIELPADTQIGAEYK